MVIPNLRQLTPHTTHIPSQNQGPTTAAHHQPIFLHTHYSSFFSQSILVSRRSRHIRLSFERIIFSLEPENFNSIRVCCYHSMAFGFEKGNGNGRK
ncbi:hypothetical protein HBH70_128590 [Parastagonospora nodorum]|nr:hypothetical protein HBI76_040160 [Parastagonospora nodorum]KAH5085416.1 hypothetical protein HBH95_022530 [Parastagonospora nodorum]KAH5113424.1 hypothetical protein HBH72_008110 [Parastagonospora nodorum]KAH5134942.1 hypothetical protein HBH70_128590 [Parastagonospora nodorum]KAH5322895.1 hypothetical protein HBI11_036430 [Parastagonospora nodorum]